MAFGLCPRLFILVTRLQALSTLVRMHDGLPGVRPATPAGHLESVHHELGPQVVGDRPADDAPRVHVEHRGAVDLTFARRVFSDVGEPEPVRGIGTKRRRTRSSCTAGRGR